MNAAIALRSSGKPVGRVMRPAGFALLAAGALFAAAPAEGAPAATHGVAAAAPMAAAAGPQWLGDSQSDAAQRFVALLDSAGLDGLDPESFRVGGLKKLIRNAYGGNRKAIAKANAELDRSLVHYVAALRRASGRGWIVNDRAAMAPMPSSAELLAEAAAAPSLAAWIDAMPFMHPSYAGLRAALGRAVQRGDHRSADLLRINLERVRFLPAGGRYVLVNTAAQRLYAYDGGKVVDEMRVVVGKPHQPTPMMAATIKFTALNPYWNVPPDLAAERIAPNVVKEGLGYLRTHGYVVLSDWSDSAQPVDPATVDWSAVAAGRVQVRVRQNPGPGNAMGRMKFMFPNAQGVYLHDTPDKKLLNEDARLFSGGCVRLEDASRLATWLYGKPLSWKGATAEQQVDLPHPVPVYLIYQTAVANGDEVVFYDDIYGQDRSMLAGGGPGQAAAR